AAVFQVTVLERAYQQGCKFPSPLVGGGKSANHELLSLRALDLEPAHGAPPAVNRIGLLGDYPFATVLAHRVQDVLPAAADVLAVGDEWAPGQGAWQLAQVCLALEQRLRRKVLPVQLEKIGRVVGKRTIC